MDRYVSQSPQLFDSEVEPDITQVCAELRGKVQSIGVIQGLFV